VIVKFDGKFIFRQCIPRKMKHCGIKINKLCDISGYTFDMRMYLGKDTGTTTCDMTATHYTVTDLTYKVQSVWHQVVMHTVQQKSSGLNVLSPSPKVTWHTVSFIIRVV
jgi:hypothetical protein